MMPRVLSDMRMSFYNRNIFNRYTLLGPYWGPRDSLYRAWLLVRREYAAELREKRSLIGRIRERRDEIGRRTGTLEPTDPHGE